MKWSIQNLRDRQVLSELDITMVQAVLSTVPKEEWKLWVAKNDQQSEWKPILFFKEFFKQTAKNQTEKTATHPMPAAKRVTAVQTAPVEPVEPEPTVEELEGLVKLKIPPRQRRRHPRVKQSFKVVLIVGHQTFRTTTLDLSLGGMQLATSLPDHIANHTANVFIYGPNGHDAIEFKARIIQDKNDASRIEFQESEERFVAKLQEWFDQISMRGRRAA